MEAKTIKYKEYEIEIDYDHFATDPLEYSPFKFLSYGEPRLDWAKTNNEYDYAIINFINYFNLNEDFIFDDITQLSLEELSEDTEDNIKLIEKIYDKINEEFYVDILSIYEHTGLSVIRGIHKGWDAWVEGVAYVKKSNINEETASKELGELIKIYNNYLNGETYVIRIYDREGEFIDGVSFYGLDHEAQIENAKSMIDNF